MKGAQVNDAKGDSAFEKEVVPASSPTQDLVVAAPPKLQSSLNFITILVRVPR